MFIPLFEAERAWAYAMQLKAEANTEHRKHFHTIGRIKKAVAHTETFSTLCESSKCDARTKLEAQVCLNNYLVLIIMLFFNNLDKNLGVNFF